MISISIQENFRELADQFGRRWKDQLPYAASLALNKTAEAAQRDLIAEMQKVFDRPTPWTLNSTRVVYSTKAKLESRVALKDRGGAAPADKYLMAEIAGGGRREKRFEKALQSAAGLPSGYFAVPASGAKLDNFGNISAGQIKAILDYFKSFGIGEGGASFASKKRARLAKGSRKAQGFVYFVGRPGGGKLPLGIWQRFNFASGSALRPIMLYVERARYTAIFHFQDIAKRAYDREFAPAFQAAMREAIATAR